MQYHELHQRYGTTIATRIEEELTPAEFTYVLLDGLSDFLETRALSAQRAYHTKVDDPFSKEPDARGMIDQLHTQWRNAEEISYLVNVADELSSSPRARRAAG